MKNKPIISELLCDEAKIYMADMIEALGDTVTSLDSAAVELIANTYHNYITATKILQTEGFMVKSARGDIRAHPAVKIQLDAQIQLDKLMDKFGLNPKSRKEINKPKEKANKLSPIDEYINNNREVR